MEIKIGDIVVLKSGGPKMTICAFGGTAQERTAACKWFVDGTPNVWEGTFSVSALMVTTLT